MASAKPVKHINLEKLVGALNALQIVHAQVVAVGRPLNQQRKLDDSIQLIKQILEEQTK